MDNRGVTPVVGKSLEITIVLLYIGLLTAVLFGNVVPSYSAATGEEIGDRVLTTATERIRHAVPPKTEHVRARYGIELPVTIRGKGYSIRATRNGTLVLDHPDPAIDGHARLSVLGVSQFDGEWHSHEELTIHVQSGDDGILVTLEGKP